MEPHWNGRWAWGMCISCQTEELILLLIVSACMLSIYFKVKSMSMDEVFFLISNPVCSKFKISTYLKDMWNIATYNKWLDKIFIHKQTY